MNHIMRESVGFLSFFHLSTVFLDSNLAQGALMIKMHTVRIRLQIASVSFELSM